MNCLVCDIDILPQKQWLAIPKDERNRLTKSGEQRKLGGRGIGCELKPNYYEQAVANLATVDDVPAEVIEEALFDEDIA